MNDPDSTDNLSDLSYIDQGGLLTEEDTSRVQTITDLWVLAKVVKDVRDDAQYDYDARPM